MLGAKSLLANLKQANIETNSTVDRTNSTERYGSFIHQGLLVSHFRLCPLLPRRRQRASLR